MEQCFQQLKPTKPGDRASSESARDGLQRSSVLASISLHTSNLKQGPRILLLAKLPLGDKFRIAHKALVHPGFERTDFEKPASRIIRMDTNLRQRFGNE